MSYDCGACLAKYTLCLFNFILFLLGGCVLAVGIWLAADSSSFINFTHVIENSQGQKLPELTSPVVIEQAAYILIAAGSFVFIISFLGYCGALRESRCLLTTYGILLIMILLLEIAAGGLAAAYRGQAERETKTFLKTTIKNYYASETEEDAVTVMWNHLMAQLSCCGVDGFEDFKASEKWQKDGQKLPKACCKLSDKTLITPANSECIYNPGPSNSYYKTGCYGAFIAWVNQHINIVIGVGIGLGLVQLMAIFLAFCLVKSINSYFK